MGQASANLQAPTLSTLHITAFNPIPKNAFYIHLIRLKLTVCAASQKSFWIAGGVTLWSTICLRYHRDNTEFEGLPDALGCGALNPNTKSKCKPSAIQILSCRRICAWLVLPPNVSLSPDNILLILRNVLLQTHPDVVGLKDVDKRSPCGQTLTLE